MSTLAHWPVVRPAQAAVELAQVHRALEQRDEALAVLEPGLGVDSPDLVTTLEGRALALAETGDDTEAEALYRRSQAIAAARLAPGHPEAVRLAGNMAGFLADRDRPDEALAVLRPARRDLFARSGLGLEGGDPLRRAAPLFARQVRASWDLAAALQTR